MEWIVVMKTWAQILSLVTDYVAGHLCGIHTQLVNGIGISLRL